jgi:hypothetical protein
MLVAGIDIGNSTTEILIAEGGPNDVRPVLARSCSTGGSKGSHESISTAARLLDRAEQTLGRRCGAIAMAPLVPALTLTAEITPASADPSPIENLSRSEAMTPAGSGFGKGVATPLAALSDASVVEPVVVIVPGSVDFEVAAAELARAQAGGVAIAGVAVANDDAVLIANRLPFSVPIVDEIDIARLRPDALVAVEVASAGQTLRVLSDPVAVARAFGLPPEQAGRLVPLTQSLADARSAVLVIRPESSAEGAVAGEGWLEYDEAGQTMRMPLSADPAQLARVVRPGTARKIRMPMGASEEVVEIEIVDFFAVDLPEVDRVFSPRAGSIDLRKVPFSLLACPQASAQEASSSLAHATGRPVSEVLSEPAAAALGASSTPGCPADAAVCDLGGGTIDLICGGDNLVVAGAGQLLTLTVGQVLGIPLRLAEYVKRVAAFRPEAPHIVRYEDGSRAFVSNTISADSLGRLCIATGLSTRAFSDSLAPEEWRALRLAVKRGIVGANIARCLRNLSETPTTLLLCGGAALDAESVRIVTDAVSPLGVTVGRADVGGRFGPRYAVAYGLADAALSGM